MLLFIGLTDAFESEGYDRSHIKMPTSHVTLVNELLKVNKNVIVVLSCGSPVEIGEWDKGVKAILNVYLGGQAGGEATYNLLYGKVNPSGKLAETFPVCENDYLGSKYFRMGPRTVEYRESVYVGYRYYDSAKNKSNTPSATDFPTPLSNIPTCALAQPISAKTSRSPSLSQSKTLANSPVRKSRNFTSKTPKAHFIVPKRNLKASKRYF